MRSSVRVAFAALVCSFSLPATLITNTHAVISAREGLPNSLCDHTGTTFSHCEAESFDSATGAFYRAEATAEASYGYLSVESIISPNYENSPADAWASASFTDRVTVTGSDRIAYVQPVWDTSDLPCFVSCNVDFAFAAYAGDPFTEGNTLQLTAGLWAGDPFGYHARVRGSIRLESIRVFDAGWNQLTGLYYRSESGTAYNVEGATQVPEPGSALTAAAALTILAAVRRWRRISS